MSDLPYIPFFTSDFLAGTSGMTASTKGIYITLICLIYETEGPLSQRWDMLARRCGCTLPAFKKALSELEAEAKIEITENGVWSQKCEKHLALRRERRASATSAAKKRREKIEQKQGKADAGAYDPQCQPHPEPEPYLKKEEEGANLSDFERYQEAHPKPATGIKEIAETEAGFHSLIARGCPPEKIIETAQRYSAEVSGWSPQAKVQGAKNFLSLSKGKIADFLAIEEPEVTDDDLRNIHKKANTINNGTMPAGFWVSEDEARTMLEQSLVPRERLESQQARQREQMQ